MTSFPESLAVAVFDSFALAVSWPFSLRFAARIWSRRPDTAIGHSGRCATVLRLLLALAPRPVTAIAEPRAPHFLHEPPPRVEFLNGTGAVVPCVAHGSPPPRLTWSTRTGQPLHEVPGLRHMRADGSLVLPPFRAEDFKEDVHSAVYRCLATNSMGTIGSHDVRVRAGELSQAFSA
ncbi:hypothetical protein MRX96_036886 [Rhipicephalus microplus]